MKRWSRMLIGCLAVLGSLCTNPALSASSESVEERLPSLVGLGRVEFPTSGTQQSQPWFLRGVLLLHNFQYDDAQEAFRHAQLLDPTFAMAYWGEAMTANHPLWSEQNVKEGRAILQRLAPDPETRLTKAPTEREKGYLRAIDALFSEGDKVARDRAYADAMHELTEAFPDDLEAAAFYALAILGMTQGDRDHASYMKAAAIAEEVFLKNPQHPGAVHYLIHAYDDPIHAPLGLRAARIYASLAPAASHAQHMPSHIFMALGMWDEAITANKAAWASSEARIERKGLAISARPYHTLRWQMYAHLQNGEALEAKRLLNVIEDDAQQTRSAYARGYRASMRATYIVETEKWDDRYLDGDRSDLDFSFAVSELFASGMSAVKTHNQSKAKQALAQLNDKIAQQSTDSPSRHETAALSMAKALEALILFAESQPQKALTLLQEAATLEDSLPYSYGPPFPVKPAHELLGEVLLELRQPERAKQAFDRALKRAPKRRLSLAGMRRITTGR